MNDELILWIMGPKGKNIYLHRNCPVSHEEMAQRLGYSGLSVGMNPTVREADGICAFCEKKFDV